MSIALEVDVADLEQQACVVKRFVDAVLPPLAAGFRRSDTPTLTVDEAVTGEQPVRALVPHGGMNQTPA